MLQTLVYLAAAYVITRMVQLLVEKRKETSTLTMLFAIITILIAIYAVANAILAGETISNILSSFK
jgi:Na+/proline symporter